MTLRPEYIVIGQFGRAHGVSGEVYINSLTDNPDRFRELKSFWVETVDGWKEMNVTNVKFVSGRPVIKIAGLDSPEAVKPLLNEYLHIGSEKLEKLPEGSYYLFDLVDCRVEDTAGKEMGVVLGVEQYPANDILVIGVGEKKFEMPLVRRFLKKIDIDNKLVVIDPPEGIFDSPDKN
ncbi:putative Ribosome maturation factor RimM [Candidatus Zixiibacteriota bacterium]|nr:putative Ribosome maturation factor RimM [candidate division Zixibacteria bacterium]